MAWHPLGWMPVFFSENEPFPSAVLAHHYPDVPNFGDMTRYKEWPDADIDVLVGGTPCQAFSIAGLRKGLADPRGNLTLTYLAIAERYRPEWLVWENVPGVLSDKTGAFGCLLGGLAAIGYGWAYRILDAQYFGLAQRRKRVFVVGSVRGWASAAAVLFERESLRGDPAPSRQARESTSHELSPSIGASGRGFSRAGETRGQDPVGAASLTSGSHLGSNAPGRRREDDINLVTHALRAEGFDASEDGTGRGIPLIVGTLSDGSHQGGGRNGQDAYTGRIIPVASREKWIPRGLGDRDSGGECGECADFVHGGASQVIIEDDLAQPITARHGDPGMIAFDTTQVTSAENRSNPQPGDPYHPLASRAHPPAIASSSVRRLTPRECERLQGFPDDFTAIPYKGKPAADGPRYKALGNSMAVPVMRWIGGRIALIDAIHQEEAA